MALAYEAGAELLDMEFVQFHPTGMVWPPGVQGILVTEAVRGEGGILRNKNGERFMEKYDPKRMELSTRDVVARSIYTEVKEGRGTPHGGAFLDISHKPAEYVKRKLPSMYHQFKELADVDITKGPMEVGPTCHYVMGGIRVDAETGQSSVPGLFAAGEAAGGLHGANRLGGNSLSDLLVFGRRAGFAAAEHAKKTTAPSLNDAQIEEAEREVLAPFERSEGENPYTIHHDLQDVMQKPGRNLPHGRGSATGARRTGETEGAREEDARGRIAPVQSGLAFVARPAVHADGFRGVHARGAGAQGKPRRAQPPRFPEDGRRVGQEEHRDREKGRRDDAVRSAARRYAGRIDSRFWRKTSRK